MLCTYRKPVTSDLQDQQKEIITRSSTKVGSLGFRYALELCLFACCLHPRASASRFKVTVRLVGRGESGETSGLGVQGLGFWFRVYSL